MVRVREVDRVREVGRLRDSQAPEVVDSRVNPEAAQPVSRVRALAHQVQAAAGPWAAARPEILTRPEREVRVVPSAKESATRAVQVAPPADLASLVARPAVRLAVPPAVRLAANLTK